MKFMRNLTIWLLIIFIGIWGYSLYTKSQVTTTQLSYSELLQLIEEGKVKKVTLEDNIIFGITKDEENIKTFAPSDPDLIKILRAHKVEIEARPPSTQPWWLTVLSFLPYILLITFFMLIFRHAQTGGSQAFTFGRSRAKLFDDKRPKVTFADVAGLEEALEELQEVVEFLKFPKKFQALGARIPKGVLLLGPPGCGKTLLGRAIAGEAGVPFYYISGSDFVEMFVGVGASRVRDMFEQAKKSSPCILFIDEIDAVGRHRGAGLGGGHDEREQTLNQLLVEMDGFEANAGVIIIAATNRPDILDPALLRPGRFDRQIVVDQPDVKGRKSILEVHSRGKSISPEARLDIIAKMTPGFSGADLENLLNEAALLAARKNKKQIEMEDMEEATERVIAGPERKSRVITEKEKLTIAYHEAGHALVGKLLPNTDPVHKVTILPRGLALGYTMHLPKEDRHIQTKSELLAQMSVLLAGRVAEELIFKELSTGAQNDLEKVTTLARHMVCEYGMSEELGPRTFGKKERQVFLGRDIYEERNYSENTADKIDKEIHHLIDSRYQVAKEILANNRDKLEKIAKALLEKEIIEGEELDRILEEVDEARQKEESITLQNLTSSPLFIKEELDDTDKILNPSNLSIKEIDAT